MSSEREWPEDTAFERRLLESARGDARPHEVKEAWSRFAARLSVLLPEPGGTLEGPPARLPAPAPAAPWGAAAKWLLLGAIGGGGLTAGLMIQRRPPALDRPPLEHTMAPAARAGARAPAPETTEEGQQAPELPRALSGHVARARVRSPHAGAPSTLAAEVSRIDTARTAIASGDYDGAMRLVERYHADFPGGALAPDADVVALEAAAAKRDRAETARRARGFLLRYPNDPHAARVRWLAAHPGER